MKITFITTVEHNVGDDFVREGIEYIISNLMSAKPKYSYIHKHVPATVRKGFSNLRSLKASERLERFIPIWLTPDKIKDADIIIQSGAPMYWYHSENVASYKNEWYEALIEKRFDPGKQKLLNIGVGSCQLYYDDVESFGTNNNFTRFVEKFYRKCELTTVRDQLSLDLLNKLGLKGSKLPCPSIFSADSYDYTGEKGKYVVLNYMRGGGHFDFANKIDPEKWENEMLAFYQFISKQEEVVFVCHNQNELNEANRLFPNAEVFFSNDYFDYMEFYSKAKFGIVNRVHSAFQMASHLIPSFVIGADSRARMLSEISLKSEYVSNVSYNTLVDEYQYLVDNRERLANQIYEIKKRSLKDYTDLIKNHLKK